MLEWCLLLWCMACVVCREMLQLMQLLSVAPPIAALRIHFCRKQSAFLIRWTRPNVHDIASLNRISSKRRLMSSLEFPGRIFQRILSKLTRRQVHAFCDAAAKLCGSLNPLIPSEDCRIELSVTSPTATLYLLRLREAVRTWSSGRNVPSHSVWRRFIIGIWGYTYKIWCLHRAQQCLICLAWHCAGKWTVTNQMALRSYEIMIYTFNKSKIII